MESVLGCINLSLFLQIVLLNWKSDFSNFFPFYCVHFTDSKNELSKPPNELFKLIYT